MEAEGRSCLNAGFVKPESHQASRVGLCGGAGGQEAFLCLIIFLLARRQEFPGLCHAPPLAPQALGEVGPHPGRYVGELNWHRDLSPAGPMAASQGKVRFREGLREQGQSWGTRLPSCVLWVSVKDVCDTSVPQKCMSNPRAVVRRCGGGLLQGGQAFPRGSWPPLQSGSASAGGAMKARPAPCAWRPGRVLPRQKVLDQPRGQTYLGWCPRAWGQ